MAPHPTISHPQRHLLFYVPIDVFRSELFGKARKGEKGREENQGKEKEERAGEISFL